MSKNKQNKETGSKEIRCLNISEIHLEKRGDDNKESRKVEGYAALFDTETQINDWLIESIDKNAFDKCNYDDCIMCFNHDENQIVARYSAKTLTLEVDDKGLKFSAEMPNTSAGNDILENIRCGNIQGCSFAFIVKSAEWTFSDNSNEPDRRNITEIDKLYDVSPVVHPAYADTTVALRAKEEHSTQKDEERKIALSAKIQQEKRERSYRLAEMGVSF